jgi:hypothetical protein
VANFIFGRLWSLIMLKNDKFSVFYIKWYSYNRAGVILLFKSKKRASCNNRKHFYVYL